MPNPYLQNTDQPDQSALHQGFQPLIQAPVAFTPEEEEEERRRQEQEAQRKEETFQNIDKAFSDDQGGSLDGIDPLDLEEYHIRKEEEEIAVHNLAQEGIAAAAGVGNSIVSPGVIDKIGKLARGLSGITQGVLDTPKNLTYWAATNFLPADDIDSPEDRKALMLAIGSMSQASGSALGGAEGASKFLREDFGEAIEPLVKDRGDQDFIDAFGEGELLKGADYLLGDVVEALPSVAAAFSGAGGLALIGTSAFGNKFSQEFEEDPGQNANLLFANAASTAGGELLTEMFTAGLGKGIGTLASKLGSKTAKAVGKNAINKLLFGLTGEGLSEGAADTWERASDYAILGDDKAFEGGWRSFAQNAIIGGIIGGGITTTQLGGRNSSKRSIVENTITPNQIKKSQKESAGRINQMQSELQNAKKKGDQDAIDILQKRITKEERAMANSKNKVSDHMSHLSPKQVKKMADNNIKAENLQRKVDDGTYENDPVTESAIQAEIDALHDSTKTAFSNPLYKDIRESRPVTKEAIELAKNTEDAFLAGDLEGVVINQAGTIQNIARQQWETVRDVPKVDDDFNAFKHALVTGKGGVLDIIKKYDPEKAGTSNLAAKIAKELKGRAKRIINEFTVEGEKEVRKNKTKKPYNPEIDVTEVVGSIQGIPTEAIVKANTIAQGFAKKIPEFTNLKTFESTQRNEFGDSMVEAIRKAGLLKPQNFKKFARGNVDLLRGLVLGNPNLRKGNEVQKGWASRPPSTQQFYDYITAADADLSTKEGQKTRDNRKNSLAKQLGAGLGLKAWNDFVGQNPEVNKLLQAQTTIKANLIDSDLTNATAGDFDFNQFQADKDSDVSDFDAQSQHSDKVIKEAGLPGKTLDTKNDADFSKGRDWVANTLTQYFPKAFFTQGMFANAGKSAQERGFFFTSKGDLDSALDTADAFGPDGGVDWDNVGRYHYRNKTAQQIRDDVPALDKQNKANTSALKFMYKQFEQMIKDDPANAGPIASVLKSAQNSQNHLSRIAAPIRAVSTDLSNGVVEEHTMPQSAVARYLFQAAVNGEVDKAFPNIEKNFFQVLLAKGDDAKLKGTNPITGEKFNYSSKMPKGWRPTDNAWARYFNDNVIQANGGIDPNSIELLSGQTIAQAVAPKPTIKENKAITQDFIDKLPTKRGWDGKGPIRSSSIYAWNDPQVIRVNPTVYWARPDGSIVSYKHNDYVNAINKDTNSWKNSGFFSTTKPSSAHRDFITTEREGNNDYIPPTRGKRATGPKKPRNPKSISQLERAAQKRQSKDIITTKGPIDLGSLFDTSLIQKKDPDSPYVGSKFEAFVEQIATTRGKVGEYALMDVMHQLGHDVTEATHTNHDLKVDGKNIELKTSTLNKGTGKYNTFSFLQLRPKQSKKFDPINGYDDYMFAVVLPNSYRVFKASPDQVQKLIDDGDAKSQHGGKEGKSGTYGWYPTIEDLETKFEEINTIAGETAKIETNLELAEKVADPMPKRIEIALQQQYDFAEVEAKSDHTTADTFQVLEMLQNAWSNYGLNVQTDPATTREILKRDNYTDAQITSLFSRASGFVSYGKDGVQTIYVDPAKANPNTPIHEFGHIWNGIMQKDSPHIFEAIINKIQQEAPGVYANQVERLQRYDNLDPNSIEGRDEIMAGIIGDHGQLRVSQAKTKLGALINQYWKAIQNILGFNFQGKKLQDLNVKQVMDLIADEVITGKPGNNIKHLDGQGWVQNSVASRTPGLKLSLTPEYAGLVNLRDIYGETGSLSYATKEAFETVKEDWESFDDFADFVKKSVKEKEAKEGELDLDFYRPNIGLDEKSLIFDKATIIQKRIEAVRKNKAIAVRLAKEVGLKNKFKSIIAEGSNRKPSSIFISPNAEDFQGLLDGLLPKGRKQADKGAANQKWLKDNLIDPYVNGINGTETDIAAHTGAWKKLSGKKNLNKEVIGGFTIGDAILTSLADGDTGLSSTVEQALVGEAANHPDLVNFLKDTVGLKFDKEKLGQPINKTIFSHVNKQARDAHMGTFKATVDGMFDKEAWAAIEKSKGTKYAGALKNTIDRMKSGRNRNSVDAEANTFNKWLGRAVGTTMFLNTRSAALQLISTINYATKPGNGYPNMVKTWFGNRTAAKAAAKELLNTGYMQSRVSGSKFDLLADELSNSDSVIDDILKKGFSFTKWGDKSAIIWGGVPYYLSRQKAIKAENPNLSDAEVKKQAVNDFIAATEESQQSADPSRISQVQASSVGKLIYAFANTPFQYARITKKRLNDLGSGRSAKRGSQVQDLREVVWYSSTQAALFTTLQSGIAALAMGDYGENEEKISEKVLNGIESSLISLSKTLGHHGAIAGALWKLYDAAIIDGKTGDRAAVEVLGISPPIQTKFKDLRNTLDAAKKAYKGGDARQAAYAFGEASSFVGLPIDRVLKKVNNLATWFNEEAELYQKIFRTLGWGDWDVGGGNLITPEWGKKSKFDLDLDLGLDLDLDLDLDLGSPLNKGAVGQTFSDGTIEVDPDLSPLEKEKTIAHEQQHVKDMKDNGLDYDDNYVYFKGSKHKRSNGQIEYNGKMLPEGDKNLPWEAHAYAAESPLKQTGHDEHEEGGHEETTEFTNEWFNDPATRERLATQSGLTNPEIDQRLTEATGIVPQQDAFLGADAEYDQGFVRGIREDGTHGDIDPSDPAYQKPKIKLGVDPTAEGNKATLAHEQGHALGFDNKLGYEAQKILGKAKGSNTSEARYLNNPGETYGHLQGLRKATGLKPFERNLTPKKLEALLKFSGADKDGDVQRLLRNYDIKDLTKALNTVAENDPKKKSLKDLYSNNNNNTRNA